MPPRKQVRKSAAKATARAAPTARSRHARGPQRTTRRADPAPVGPAAAGLAHAAADAAVSASLDRVVAEFGLGAPDVAAAASRRRRGAAAADGGDVATLALVREDGRVRWVYDPPTQDVVRGLRRGPAPVAARDRVHAFSFRELPSNEIIAAIEKLDATLTPNPGLRRLRNGAFVPAGNAKITGRALLLVHGTFSKSEMYLDELAATPEGRAFLAEAERRYDAILAFEHPTLASARGSTRSTSRRRPRTSSATLDVVAHSRGGLVVAWWLRNGPRKVGNVVLVGSPLAGTSLASPARLRQALDMLANTFRALELAGRRGLDPRADDGRRRRHREGGRRRAEARGARAARRRGRRHRARPRGAVARRQQRRTRAPRGLRLGLHAGDPRGGVRLRARAERGAALAVLEALPRRGPRPRRRRRRRDLPRPERPRRRHRRDDLPPQCAHSVEAACSTSAPPVRCTTATTSASRARSPSSPAHSPDRRRASGPGRR